MITVKLYTKYVEFFYFKVMEKKIIRMPLNQFNSVPKDRDIINLESENFTDFEVIEVNSKSVKLRQLIDIRDITKCSSAERKFADKWLQLYPDVSLYHQYNIDRYRADFYHHPSKTVIEIHGGIWLGKQGRSGHGSGVGLTNDVKKLNTCMNLGYKFFALTPELICEEWLRLIHSNLVKNSR